MVLEGTQISHYRLQRFIGSGAMGEVYLAEDIRIARPVAVKILKNEGNLYPDAQATNDALRLFQREMKAITALDHPNILPLFDFGEQVINKATCSYMVMPFRPEGSLVDWLQQRKNTALLSPQEVVHIVYQAAEALQHAHNRHLVHLDVKPSNFLIRHHQDSLHPSDMVLADFGIAKFTTITSTASQTIRGTPPYMAPEQWTGTPVAATDQYALAIMAYQLLTGKYPFEGNMQQVMYQHLQERPQPPSTLNPQILPSVDRVILRALEKKPENRFPSIQAFATAYEQAWQSGRLPTSSPMQSARRTPLLSTQDIHGRKRTLSIIAAIVAVLLFGGYLISLATTNHPTQSSSPNATNPNVISRSQQQSASYPHLASAYHGTAHNITSGATGTMDIQFSDISQDGNISGKCEFGIPFNSDGSFHNGHITTNGTVDFVVQPYNGSSLLTFIGFISADGILSGTYTYQGSTGSGNGTWNVSQNQSATSPTPNVSGVYSGSITNTTMNQSSNIHISFNTVAQNGNCSGYFSVDPPLYGNGRFSGNISGSTIQFAVTPDDSSLYLMVFTGTIKGNGTMSGDYTYSSNGHGTWQTLPR